MILIKHKNLYEPQAKFHLHLKVIVTTMNLSFLATVCESLQLQSDLVIIRQQLSKALALTENQNDCITELEKEIKNHSTKEFNSENVKKFPLKLNFFTGFECAELLEIYCGRPVG